MRSFLASLRVHLLLVVLLAVLPAVGMFIYTAGEQRRQGAQHAREHALELSRLASRAHEQAIIEARALLTALARLPEVRGQDAARCSALLTDVAKELRGYTTIVVAKPDGTIFCSGMPLPGPATLADRPYFQRVIESRQFAAGEYVIGRVSRKGTVPLAMPSLDDSGVIRAVVVSGVDVTWLEGLATTAQLPPGSRFSILDGNGIVLARQPDPGGWVGRSVADTPAFKSMIALGGEGTAEVLGLDGSVRLYAFTRLAGAPNIYVRVGIPRDVAFADANRILRRNLAGLGLATALILAVAWVAANSLILRRVGILTNAASRLGAGDLSVRTALPHREGELGQLAAAFDGMAEALQARHTEIARAQQALRETRDYLDKLIQYANAPIIVWDPAGRITRFNQAFERLTGYSAEEVVDRELSMLFPEGSRDESLRKIVGTLSGEYWESVEIPIRRKDGDTRLALWNSANIYAEDGTTLLATIAQGTDITERKRMEAEILRRNRELSALYRVSRGTAGSLDVEKVLDDAVSATLEALEVEGGGIFLLEPDGETMTLRVHRGVSDEFVKSVGRIRLGEGISGRAAAEKKPVVLDVADYPSQRLAPFIAKEGLQTLASVPLLSGGTLVGALNLATRRRRAFPSEELELLAAIGRELGGAVHNAQLYERAQVELAERMRAEAELRRSNEELQQFAYVASHDLQEPLRMVASYTQLLARRYQGKLDSDADEFIAYAVDGANRMQKMINDLLVYSRVGTRGGAFEPTDSDAVLDQALANLEAAIRESGAVVTRDPLPTVTADPSQLAQVFQNLVGNAVKFRGEEPPRVHVAANRQGSDWIFSVRDNGIGVEPEYADRIFVVFQRLNPRAAYPGTGIGLAICKRIVERHGGRVWVESEPAKGSTFYFSIPARGGF